MSAKIHAIISRDIPITVGEEIRTPNMRTATLMEFTRTRADRGARVDV